MAKPGLKRDEQVFINRVTKDYLRDELPNPEQIRSDVQRICKIAIAQDGQIEKLMRREA